MRSASSDCLQGVLHAIARWEKRTGVDIESVLDMPPREFLCVWDWAEGAELREHLLELLNADDLARR